MSILKSDPDLMSDLTVLFTHYFNINPTLIKRSMTLYAIGI